MRIGILSAFLLASLVLGSSARAESDPPRSEVDRPKQVGLIAGGLAVSALAYGATYAWSADFPDHMEGDRKRIRVPFVGPILWATHGIATMCDRDEDGEKMMFCGGGGYVVVGVLAFAGGAIAIVDTIAQIGGVAAAVVGVVAPPRLPIRQVEVANGMSLTPNIGIGTIGLTGTF